MPLLTSSSSPLPTGHASGPMGVLCRALATRGSHAAHQLLLLQKNPLSSSLSVPVPSQPRVLPAGERETPRWWAQALGRGLVLVRALLTPCPREGQQLMGLNLRRTEGPVVQKDVYWARPTLAPCSRLLGGKTSSNLDTGRLHQAEGSGGRPHGPSSGRRRGTDTEEGTGLRPAPSPAREVATTLLSPQQPPPSAGHGTRCPGSVRAKGARRTHPWDWAPSPALQARVSWGDGAQRLGSWWGTDFPTNEFLLKKSPKLAGNQQTPATPGTRGHGLGVSPGQPCRCLGLGTGPI